MRKFCFFFLFFLASCVYAYCAQESRIELNDGSVINGQIVSYANGVYVLDTPAFGVIKVGGEKVARIESAGTPSPITSVGSPVSSGTFNQSEINAYKQKWMSSPASAAAITSLASDSRIQALVEDPQVQAAIASGDIQSLMKNEKFMSIVNNPNVQESLKKLKQ